MQIRCKEVTVLMPWPCLSKILAVKICVLAAVKTHKEGCFACAHRHLVAVISVLAAVKAHKEGSFAA